MFSDRRVSVACDLASPPQRPLMFRPVVSSLRLRNVIGHCLMMICTMLVDIVFFGEALPERFAVCAKQVSHML